MRALRQGCVQLYTACCNFTVPPCQKNYYYSNIYYQIAKYSSYMSFDAREQVLYHSRQYPQQLGLCYVSTQIKHYSTSNRDMFMHNLKLKSIVNEKRNEYKRAVALYVCSFIIAMIGFAFASIPLYKSFCAATGLGGTTQVATIEDMLNWQEKNDKELEKAVKNRRVRVSFMTTVSDELPWKFTPAQDFVWVQPGKSSLAFFTAENTSDKTLSGVSVYHVLPDAVGRYFYKIQCFCFEEQKLRPGEQVDMPVFFYLDPEFARDKRTKRMNDIILSYQFYPAGEEATDEILEMIEEQKQKMQAQMMH